MAELWKLTASELAPLIAERMISAKEAVASVLARIEAVNPALNSIVERMVHVGPDLVRLALRIVPPVVVASFLAASSRLAGVPAGAVPSPARLAVAEGAFAPR
jgi:Asp-tRNA(Asn)/Glu-tRNA(Gln) amidotransferase A subunit family amidase